MNITPEQLKTIVKEAIQEAIPQQPKATMTIHECAKYSGIGKDKLMQLAHSQTNDFPSFKVGTKFLISREMFDSWLNKVTQEGRTL